MIRFGKFIAMLALTAMIGFCLPFCMFSQTQEAQGSCHDDQKQPESQVTKWCCSSKALLTQAASFYQAQDLSAFVDQDPILAAHRINLRNTVGSTMASIADTSPAIVPRT